MKYNSKEDIKNLLTQLDLQLSQIEVKGDSVMVMAGARGLTKHIHDSLVEIMDKFEEKEE